MGTLYRANCSKCGYEEEFPLGSGLRGIDLLWNIRVLEHKDQVKIKNMHENDEISFFSVENKLTRCCHCNDFGPLKAKVIITVTDQLQHDHNFGHQCSSCGNELEIYEESLIEKPNAVICPKCGEKVLAFQKIGFWD